MRLLNSVATAIALIPLSVGYTATAPDPKVSAVNTKVAAIQRGTLNGAYQSLHVEEKGWSEAAPASIKFFVDKPSGKLAAAQFGVGHETWASHSWYYYDESENILKYTEESVGLPVNTAAKKTAVIYKGNKPIWSNLSGAPPLSAVEVVALFRAIQSARSKVSGAK